MDNDRVSQLLARIGREDQAAFRELYKAFSRKVFAYVLNLLDDHARAEEVLVDTMYEVWRYPARFNGDSRFGTWLLAIARRKALWVARSPQPEALQADLAAIAQAARAAGPGAAAHDQNDGTRRCMAALPDAPRECMHLVFFEGLSLAEVASVLNCPESDVRTCLADARLMIKACLQSLLRREGATA